MSLWMVFALAGLYYAMDHDGDMVDKGKPVKGIKKLMD